MRGRYGESLCSEARERLGRDGEVHEPFKSKAATGIDHVTTNFFKLVAALARSSRARDSGIEPCRYHYVVSRQGMWVSVEASRRRPVQGI